MLRRSKHIPLDVHLANLQASRKRWMSRLTRAANAIARIEAAISRAEKEKARAWIEKPKMALTERDIATAVKVSAAASDDSLDARSQPWNCKTNATDEAAKAAIIAAQQAKAKAKAKASSEKRKAKFKGKLKAMPLTGKAALEFIRSND